MTVRENHDKVKEALFRSISMPMEGESDSHSLWEVDDEEEDFEEERLGDYLRFLFACTSRSHAQPWAAFLNARIVEGALLRETATAERSALAADFAALKQEQRRLAERVGTLERKMDALLAERRTVVTKPLDAHAHWIQENLETLKSMAEDWVALHIDRGILFHTSDGEQFAAMLEDLSPEDEDNVVTFHASTYA